MSMEARKDYCKMLYTIMNVTVKKELAERCEVSQQSITAWFKKHGEEWEQLRGSLILTKEAQLKRQYRRLTFLTDTQERMEEAYTESMNDDTLTKKERDQIESSFINKIAKSSDAISKIGAAIKNMETDTSISEAMEIMKDLITFTRKDDYQKAIELTGLADNYIKSLLK